MIELFNEKIITRWCRTFSSWQFMTLVKEDNDLLNREIGRMMKKLQQ